MSLFLPKICISISECSSLPSLLHRSVGGLGNSNVQVGYITFCSAEVADRKIIRFYTKYLNPHSNRTRWKRPWWNLVFKCSVYFVVWPSAFLPSTPPSHLQGALWLAVAGMLVIIWENIVWEIITLGKFHPVATIVCTSCHTSEPGQIEWIGGREKLALSFASFWLEIATSQTPDSFVEAS